MAGHILFESVKRDRSKYSIGKIWKIHEKWLNYLTGWLVGLFVRLFYSISAVVEKFIAEVSLFQPIINFQVTNNNHDNILIK